jgi:Protein of unknown function (DUF3631)
VTDDGQLLDEVFDFLGRFIAYPSAHAQVAHTLWIAHTWLMEAWESTPRIAFLSPEPGSGKSRCLEVTGPLVPRPVHAVNVTPAYLFRKVADPDGRPTVLYDEVDTVFGPKAKDAEDVRGLLNAGHRKGAIAGRCVIRGKQVMTEELPCYCAVALAGLNDVPDTIMTRSVVIRMRRRAPDEHVEPWRMRVNEPEALKLADRLRDWAALVLPAVDGAWPHIPEGVEDRAADVWEPLLAVADAAGGTWPDQARVTAVTLVTDSKRTAPSLGVTLLRDLRTVFTRAGVDRIATEALLDELHGLEESPWAELRGKPLDSRGLARLLSRYEVKSRPLRIDGKVVKGYDATDLTDPWSRYLRGVSEETTEDGTVTDDTDPGASPSTSVTSVTAVTDDDTEQCHRCGADEGRRAFDGRTWCRSCAPALYEQDCLGCGRQRKVDANGRCLECASHRAPSCAICGESMRIYEVGQQTHPTCYEPAAEDSA